jgi:hypothetical protein
VVLSDDIKLEIIQMDSEGLGSRKIAKELNIGKSTVGDFLRKKTYQKWWAEYEAGAQEPQETSEEEIIDELCDSPDEHVANLAKRLRTAQRSNTQLRRVINGSVDQTDHFEDMIKAVEAATRNLGGGIVVKNDYKKAKGSTLATAEILFSDYQIGKIGQYYNSELAHKAMAKYSKSILEELANEEYTFERIILASLGDTVEDHLKHGVQSATSTDSGLAEQMANAIEYMWTYLIQPLGVLEIPMEVYCIAGNHGSSQHKGMDMFKAGLYSYDYVIYKALEGYCKVRGWDHITFVIPEGVFGYTEIYGRGVVYEHGYFNSCTEKSLQDQKAKRSQQLKRHIEYFRCGDMHHVCDYNCGQEVVNGAFFGVDNGGEEYSGILGFNSIPAQKMMVHTREASIGRNTIKRNINIQVADGY